MSTGRTEVEGEASGGDDVIRVEMVVPRECGGWRLDHFLKFRIGRLSRTRIQGIIETQISLEGRRARPSVAVRAGERVVLERPAPVEPDVPRTFAVLHEDARHSLQRFIERDLRVRALDVVLRDDGDRGRHAIERAIDQRGFDDDFLERGLRGRLCLRGGGEQRHGSEQEADAARPGLMRHGDKSSRSRYWWAGMMTHAVHCGNGGAGA